MNPTDISYPVFKINSKYPIKQNNEIVILSHKMDKDGNEIESIQYIDNKNVPGNNLGSRRLYMKAAGMPLYRLKVAIYFFGDLIKLAKADTWFIDNNGALFKYKKTRFAELRFFKIKDVTRISSGGVLVEVAGLASRFKVLYPPNIYDKYAGILVDGMTYIFYGFYDKQYSSTRRKI